MKKEEIQSQETDKQENNQKEENDYSQIKEKVMTEEFDLSSLDDDE